MADDDKPTRGQSAVVIAAVVGALATIVAALIANWGSLFPRPVSPHTDSVSNNTASVSDNTASVSNNTALGMPVTNHVDGVQAEGQTNATAAAPGDCSNISCVTSAKVRATNVDDDAYIQVNGVQVAHYSIGQPDDWIDVTHNLRSGDNVFTYNFTNGQYGGCSATFDVEINGKLKNQLHWESVVRQENAPVNASCGVKSVNLNLE